MGIDHWLQVPTWGRQLIWFIFLFSGSMLIFSGFWPISIFTIKERSRNLAIHQKLKENGFSKGQLRFDDLWILSEFLNQIERKKAFSEGISTDLIDVYIRNVNDKLRKISTFHCFPNWNWKRSFLILIISMVVCGSSWTMFPQYFPINSRTLFPFRTTQIDQFVGVRPGDADVVWGEDLKVTVFLRVPSIHKPQLFIKGEKGWRKIKITEDDGENQYYLFKGITKPFQYRVRWKNEWGRKFNITPQKPTQIEGFHVTIQPPKYVGKEAIIQASPEITGLAGTLVNLEVELNEKIQTAQIQFTDGRESRMNILKDNKVSHSFSLDKSMGYEIIVVGEKGRKNKKRDPYPIHVVEDHPPTIELLSPIEDLIVGDKEKIPLTYNASDDFGIRTISIEIERGGRNLGRKKIKGLNRFD